MNKKGQLTIFIIVGVIIVVGVGVFFLFRQGLIPNLGGSKEINPNSFLKSCLEEKVEEGVNILEHQGGSISPLLSKKFRFDEDDRFWNITYLCYTQQFYESCVNQEPILIRHLENEMNEYIHEEVTSCLDALENSLLKQSYEVTTDYRDIGVDFVSKKMRLNIDGEIVLSKNDEESKIKNLKLEFPTIIYDLAIVAQEIVAQESRNCYFSHTGYMLMHPEYGIDIFRVEDTEIYTVRLRDSSHKFRLAVQGCRS